MKASKVLLPTVLLLTGSFISPVFAHDDHNHEQQMQVYRAAELKPFEGPENLFTGKVSVQPLFPENEIANYSGAYVTFAAGAHTAWHSHPAGQHMIVTDGGALTGTRDGKVIQFSKGESVWCPPGIDHWHGATPDAEMTHLVVTASADGENVVWKEKLTAEEYQLPK